MRKGQTKRRLRKPKPFFDKQRRRWIAKVFVGDGKYRSSSHLTKDAAFDAIDASWENRKAGIRQRVTTGEALADWLASGSEWKAKTKADYSDTVTRMSDIANIPLDTLRDVHIQQMLDAVDSTAMRKRVRKVLRTALNWCVRRKLLRVNPVATTEPVRHRRKPVDVFTRLETDLILEHAPPRWKPAMELLLLLAVRPGELWALRWKDWSVECQTLQVSRNVKEVSGKQVVESVKTEAGHRTLPLPDKAQEILLGLRASAMKRGVASKDCPIFTTQTGGMVRHGNFRHKVWRSTLTKAGVEYKSPYALRHTTATWMLNSGSVSLAAVSRWLGHSDKVTTLKHYDHLMVGELHQVSQFWARDAS